MSADQVFSIRADVVEQLRAGARLDAATVAELAQVTDILSLGALADDARRQRHGTAASFVRVHALDVARAAQWTVAPAAAHEVRLMGTPASLDDAVDAVLQAKPLAGACVLRGFSVAAVFAWGGEEACRALAATGLDELAQCHAGPGSAEAIRAARDAGLAVRVVGVDHEPANRAAWLIDVRDLQEAVGGLQAVAPLPRMIDPGVPTTGYSDVRQVSLARLVLADIPSVQVDWGSTAPSSPRSHSPSVPTTSTPCRPKTT